MSWKRLAKQELGKFAEALAKVEFQKAGWEVFATDVDLRGVDFLVRHRKTGEIREIQVKSTTKGGGVLMRKLAPRAREKRFLAVVQFRDDQWPLLYLIPPNVWGKSTGPFRNRTYLTGQKSAPEWVLLLGKKHQATLEQFKGVAR